MKISEMDMKKKRTLLTYEERVAWFFQNYYETGMEYKSWILAENRKDLDNFYWYGEKINIPKYKD